MATQEARLSPLLFKLSSVFRQKRKGTKRSVTDTSVREGGRVRPKESENASETSQPQGCPCAPRSQSLGSQEPAGVPGKAEALALPSYLSHRHPMLSHPNMSGLASLHSQAECVT
ncbi:hypothetical protein P7K49_001969 [Saguinus oedipus]|uniref:Uncharacterized protein n=1 Tax=Saguinus oedipus TaxID=9490 RepID=A0ABQ9WG05_SAGOE|nr:hypothetical protein P7K49_001969 [Saguinus oedipus]